ncbi:MAG: LCP family protein [Actinomycetota bacterium]
MVGDDWPGSDTSKPEPGRLRVRRRWLVVGILALVLAYPAWNAMSLWLTWRNVERAELDTVAFEELPPVAASADHELPEGAAAAFTPAPVEESPTADPGLGPTGGGAEFDTYMIVGSDLGGSRADVILLVLLPRHDAAPIMVSLPRDLYLPNRCTQGLTRLNANYNGCGDDINGATLLSGAVRDFTGLEVDHFALFAMEDFAVIIDRIGGTEICVEYPVRDGNGLQLPAGCTLADGETTLLWVRSRTTQELVDGRWRTMPGVSDLTRNQRQQDLILSMLSRASEFDSPAALTGFVQSLGDTFVLDDGLGMREAVDLAWTHRDLRPDDFERLTIPVQPHETTAGAQVLLPTASFSEVLAGR